MTSLKVRYERLLFAYPRDYRRRRGPEIATTFTEMAAEGQRWPRGRDAVSLLFHGLRARLGRPRSRLIVPFTVLAMLVGGLCTAAGGAGLGWGGSTGLSTRQLAKVEQLGFGPVGTTVNGRGGRSSWFYDYMSASAGASPSIMLSTSPTQLHDDQTQVRPFLSGRGLVDMERAQIAGTDWKITNYTITSYGAAMTVRSGDLVADVGSWSADEGNYEATKTTGLSIHHGMVSVGKVTEAAPNGLDAIVYRTTPSAVPVFTLLAGLLGAALTFLLIGWLSRRTSRLRALHQRLALAAVALTAVLAAPAAVVCGTGIWMARRDHSDVPIRYWGGFVTGDARMAALAAATLLALTIAGVALARPTPLATEATE